jgi:flagellar basal-body rod modification protein FlgD
MSVTGVTGASASDSTGQSTKAADLPTKIATQDTFLKLLVAQIRNQNPLNPTDGVEFLTQLAQFSQLEQTIGIRQGVDGLRQDLAQAAAGSAATPVDGGDTTDGTQTNGQQ